MNRGKLIGAVVLLLQTVPVWSQAPAPNAAQREQQQVTASEAQQREYLKQRFNAVQRLLTVSSAARQIESQGDEEARRQHAAAKERYAQAQAAFDAGDLAGAAGLLNEATRTMFAAVRGEGAGPVRAEKDRVDYANRKLSIEALLEAYERVAREKADPQEATTRAEVLQIVAEAEQLAQAGRYREGRVVLDQAYLQVKAGIAALRGGETLVRSLDFASKEEEYDYELDRNETHKMLVAMLVTEKYAKNPGLEKRVAPFLREAERLRGEAERAAQGKDHEGAIRLLEGSTNEYIKAIRNAGVYIPGG